MSFSGQPTTTNIDPTPPQIRPLQQMLVQMMMGRFMGQGRNSMPTYGSALQSPMQQLYGMGGYGTGGGMFPPRGQTPPRSGGYPISNTPPGVEMAGPGSWAYNQQPRPSIGDTTDYGSVLGQPQTRPLAIQDSMLSMPGVVDNTRGGPIGTSQGVNQPGPFAQLPSYGSVMNGSNMIRSFQPTYRMAPQFYI